MKKMWCVFFLVGCGGTASDRICAVCEPERTGQIGERGDVQTPCWYFRAPEAVDATRATELGFDVEALESAVARPIDMPMEWRISGASVGGGPRAATSV